MSQKKIKRFRKETRRVLKEEYGEGLDMLKQITRPRPKWIPKRVWVWVYLPLFERKYLHFILSNLD